MQHKFKSQPCSTYQVQHVHSCPVSHRWVAQHQICQHKSTLPGHQTNGSKVVTRSRRPRRTCMGAGLSTAASSCCTATLPSVSADAGACGPFTLHSIQHGVHSVLRAAQRLHANAWLLPEDQSKATDLEQALLSGLVSSWAQSPEWYNCHPSGLGCASQYLCCHPQLVAV
eukprot:352421-Chlamydomonas_euryale.AAC.22